MLIGLIRERKKPSDTRVVFTPIQCAELKIKYPQIDIIVESSPDRCFSDIEYTTQRIKVVTELDHCDILLGIKEVSIEHLIPNKTYFFFSHTKKMQAYNQKLMHALIEQKIRLVDYECLTHDDGQRILGFGYYAGVVGTHNGILTYGKKHQLYDLIPAYKTKNYSELKSHYQNLKLPNLKIVLTGSGRVSKGALEVLNILDIQEVSPSDFISKEYNYPVYTHLKGASLYQHTANQGYDRDDFHTQPEQYQCLFKNYWAHTDILINGIYWDVKIPRLFEKEDIQKSEFKISVISDITCDTNGSVPINVGSSTINDPVYGINKKNISKTSPFQKTNDTIDIMAVDNLPNELPQDASLYFGAQFEKYVLSPMLNFGIDNDIVSRATICKDGLLTHPYLYMKEYAYPKD